MQAFAKFFVILIPIVDSNILVDILKYKNINTAVVLNCNINIQESIPIQKIMIKNGITINNVVMNNTTSVNIPNYFIKIAVVLNTSCPEWYNLLANSDHTISFRHPYFWFIFTDNLSDTIDIISSYPVEINSEFVIINQNGTSFYQLYECYNTGYYTKGSFIMNNIGYWSNSKLYVKDGRRMNLTGVVLKCMVVITQKLVNQTLTGYLEESRPDGFDLLHKKKFYTLLKYLRDMYGFSYELHRTKSWGYLTNSSFDGMIGALQRREIDIGGSPVFFRAERFKVMDYSSETWRSKQCFIFLHPKQVGAYYTIFTRPLSTTVWYSLISLLMLSNFMLGLLLRLKVLKKRGDEDDSSFSIAFLSIWSAVCQQGMAVQRSSTSVKLVIFSTFVFTLTIYQYYNAVVVSTLLREPPKNIRSLEDLLRSNLKTGVEDVLYNIDFFRHTTNPIALQLYNKKVVTPKQRNFFKADYGMRLVKRGGFAFHVDSASGYRIMRHTFAEKEIAAIRFATYHPEYHILRKVGVHISDSCDYPFVDIVICQVQEIALFLPQNMVATVQQGSPYKGILAYGLRKMQESGLTHRIKSVWDEPKPACVLTPDTSIFSVSIVEFSTPLLLLTFGIILSIVVLLCEIGFHRLCDKKVVFAFRH